MKKYKFVFIIIFLLFAILLFSTIFSLANITNDKILNGIYINNMKVSGLDVASAYKSLYDFFNEKKSGSIIVKYEDYETSISLSQLDLSYDIQSIVNEAYG